MDKKPKILGIVCHPDDEIICGFPVFQDPNIDRHLVILCSDLHRKGPCRRRALEEVCRQEGIVLEYCADFDNNFYALPTRQADVTLSDVCSQIDEIISVSIDLIKPDYVFTHNPVGEYGHGSHRLLFELVSQHRDAVNVIFTDICTKSNHRSTNVIPMSVYCAYYGNFIDVKSGGHHRVDYKLDMDFYNRTKATYDKYSAWTWASPPVEEAGIHIINEWKQ